MTTLVFRYGLAAPHNGAELVRDQMIRAHAYSRALVWFEIGRRWATRITIDASSSEIRTAQARVEGADAACQWLQAEISDMRKQSRKRSETETMRLGLALARKQRDEAKQDLYSARARYAAQCADCRKAKSETIPCPHATAEAAALRTQLDVIDLMANELVKNARHHSGLYPGNYQIVDAAARASFGAPLYEKDGVTAHDPKAPPHNWDGEGAVAVQIQSAKPLTTDGALRANDSRLRITAPPWPEEWLANGDRSARPPRRADSIVGTGRGRRPPGTRPGSKGEPDSAATACRSDGTPARWVRDRACRHGELQLRVSSDETLKPIWAAWRLDMHRELPPNATVSWATVHRRMRGPHAEWSLTLTLDLGPAVGPEPRDRPTVALDVGWRQMGAELRVAAWRDSLGNSGELRLSEADLRALRLYETIAAERDMVYDACKARLRRWLDTCTEAPTWMRELGAHMHAWRRPSRMVALLRRWEMERPSPTGAELEAADAVRAWAIGDRARWAEQEARRLWSLRRRREIYRVFAAALATNYSVIVLEQFDLRAVAKRKLVGEDSPENEQARSNRQLAAISELRDAICNAVRVRGSVVAAVDARDSTRTCPNCGVVADRDAADAVTLVCADCHHTWDQDRSGAAPILLNRYCERPGDAKILAGAREEPKSAGDKEKKNARWARAKRMGAAKRARVAAAREASDNGAE